MLQQYAIAILDYPGCLKSALYGWQEMLQLANRLAAQQQLPWQFDGVIVTPAELQPLQDWQALLLPPSGNGAERYYLQPEDSLLQALRQHYGRGCWLASACAGSFILAATGLLQGQRCTTHWGLAAEFRQRYPQVVLDTQALLVNQGQLTTAGGLMSWVDLGLELVARLGSPALMRQLGKTLIVDTAPREQRCYQVFRPPFQHGDAQVLKVQHYLAEHYGQPLTISELAALACLSERSLQRRFNQATGYRPSHYLQRLRVQQACDLLESTALSFEQIAARVGFQDASACRKLFIRTLGVSPREFRQKFVGGTALMS